MPELSVYGVASGGRQPGRRGRSPSAGAAGGQAMARAEHGDLVVAGGARVLPGAEVDPRARLGAGTTVWPGAHVREQAELGADCIVGRGAYVDAGVRMGDRCKLQNNALVYAPAVLGDGVFIGPGAILTNDVHPRAVRPDGGLKRADDWLAAGVRVGDGAAVGAGAVVVAGVRIGAWALVGAGAVVTRDVPDHALVVGNPARRTGWVGRAGVRLASEGDGRWRCPVEDRRYAERDGLLEELPA